MVEARIMNSKDEILAYIYNKLSEQFDDCVGKTQNDLPELFYEYSCSSYFESPEDCADVVHNFQSNLYLDDFDTEYNGALGGLQIAFYENNPKIAKKDIGDSADTIYFEDMNETMPVLDAEHIIIGVNRWRIRRALKAQTKKLGLNEDAVLTEINLNQLKEKILDELSLTISSFDGVAEIKKLINHHYFYVHSVGEFVDEWNHKAINMISGLYDEDGINANLAQKLINGFVNKPELDGVETNYNGVLGAIKVIQHEGMHNLQSMIGKINLGNPCDLVRAINFIRVKNVKFN